MGCGPCKGASAVQADGSVLDRVISQASNEDQCLLYKLANYKKGGELIEAYNMGGQAEVEKLISEQFGILMYAEGKGQIINRAEYLRWKFRDHKQVVLPIEASLSRHDPLSRWHDHPACWQMRHRGALGESLLHVLIICDTRVHTRLARTLLKCFPRLALDVVEGEEYLGASALHLAIAYFNNELVQDLVEAGANVNQKAIGSFFLPRDQQRPRPSRITDYEGLAYLGEFPLAWAACCANESVYNLLLDSGADPDLPDSFGNMILHMVVVCDKLDMFGYALRHPKLPASNGRSNLQGLTPLTLACKLGRAEVFKEMLELSAKEFWRYSNITCSAYPLNALDTLLPDGRTNWNSALFIILNGTKEEHLDMLDGGIIQRLLEEKWKTFARNQFLKRLLILFIHLVCLSLGVYLRPAERNAPLLGVPRSAREALRYACELCTLAGVLSYVLLQQGDEVKNQGLAAFLKQLTHAPAKAIFLVSNLLILACIPYRLIGDREAEEAILVFAVPGSWFLLMFFAGAVRLTGPFVTMIYSMITGDMLTFGIIYMIVLFGFSQSFYFLYKGFPGVKNSLFGSYPSTWMALFQITLGDYSYADLSFTTYPNLSKTVFALFMVFVPILLLNMLIAMMGNTYAHVIEQSEKEWMKQWAKIVVTLERAVPQSDAHHYLQEYSIGLGPSDDPRYEQRGVMVIKSKAKTRAKQRKGAVTNWKRVGKVTINELRKRGMTGEDLRRIMWGRASISTPTKIPTKPLADTSLQPGGQNITGGFGEALSTALDVMAFTHELDMVGANGLTLKSNARPVQAANPNVQLPAGANPVAAPAVPLGSFAGTQALGKPLPQGLVPPGQALPRVYSDPLREIVHLSDSKDSSEYEDKIKTLAVEAANLFHVQEVEPIVKPKTKPNPTVSVAGALTNLFGVETPAGPTVDWRAGDKRQKKLSAMEPSDSEGLGEAPLLGRSARTRRARSASKRSAGRGGHAVRSARLRLQPSSSLEGPPPQGDHYPDQRLDENTEANIYRIANVSHESEVAEIRKTLALKDVRPHNIEQAVGGGTPALTVRHMDTIAEKAVIIKGEGSGVEVESGNNDLSENRCADEDGTYSKDRRKVEKRKTRVRPKTARYNRVAPMVPVSEEARSGPRKRVKSAHHSKGKVQHRSEEPTSPPDPLENWSTAGLASMNSLLSWEHESDGY